MKEKIEFIYFDVGGVVILDFSKTNKKNEMLDALGIVSKSDRKIFNEMFVKFEPLVCVNKKTLEEFTMVMASELKLQLPKGYQMLEEFVNRFELNTSMHPILEKLSSRYKLGLLTNMYPDMLNRIKNRGLLPSKIQWE